jgi:hypothetical protein
MMDDNEMYVMLLLLKVKIAENHNAPQNHTRMKMMTLLIMAK